jgi:hypothetical protein
MTQTAVEQAQASRVSASSRNHLRRRKKRDQVRARMKSVHMMCGKRMPKRAPGMVEELSCLC